MKSQEDLENLKKEKCITELRFTAMQFANTLNSISDSLEKGNMSEFLEFNKLVTWLQQDYKVLSAELKKIMDEEMCDLKLNKMMDDMDRVNDLMPYIYIAEKLGETHVLKGIKIEFITRLRWLENGLEYKKKHEKN